MVDGGRPLNRRMITVKGSWERVVSRLSKRGSSVCISCRRRIRCSERKAGIQEKAQPRVENLLLPFHGNDRREQQQLSGEEERGSLALVSHCGGGTESEVSSG